MVFIFMTFPVIFFYLKESFPRSVDCKRKRLGAWKKCEEFSLNAWQLNCILNSSVEMLYKHESLVLGAEPLAEALMCEQTEYTLMSRRWDEITLKTYDWLLFLFKA
jgi:hypothetical protein